MPAGVLLVACGLIMVVGVVDCMKNEVNGGIIGISSSEYCDTMSYELLSFGMRM